MTILERRATASPPGGPLIDSFGRAISYLRVSVTDRCDFRCVYCMSEDMTFLPKKDLLSLEELDRLIGAFAKLGTRRVRLTGGEPLVRRNVMSLFETLGSRIAAGELDEVTLTTNGSQLARFADQLYGSGVRRINVSLDTLKPDRFTRITRWGDINQVLAGIDAALVAGLKVKINTVALKDFNEDEFDDLIRFAHGRGMDLSLIEAMPLGENIGDRTDQYLPLSQVRERLEREWTLEETDYRTGGPARYLRVAESGGRLGLITPMTHNFCSTCNRVRVTCTGTLYMCLGKDDCADLRGPLRASDGDGDVIAAIREAMTRKPKGHDFVIERFTTAPAVSRHMSVTGG
ncbi:MAG: GTP 3',8-cyclase MoaA [Ancalomicrobiaceae bacterium]|nr:GTP 3',8-cyclase MoaA [Ancalomicrobiaceae bacterium]